MPGRRDQRIPIDKDLCRRCQTNEIAITVRTEPLCKECFVKYVHTKIVKRLEAFRVRHSTPENERVLLLPLSLGTSSVALLHVLSSHLKRQTENTGRTGFKLCVLHVSTPAEDIEKTNACFEAVKQRYPEHDYHAIPLSDVFDPEVIEANDLPPALHPTGSDGTPIPDQRLQSLLQTLNSTTSRSDISQILLRKLIVSFAKNHSCEALLWGDSTTHLASRTLAETAKGRGYSLPWYSADGESPLGLPCYYPMKDLLSKEIVSYTGFVEPGMDDVVMRGEQKPQVSMRGTTIDELMTKYFAGVELEFPSIVSNVVKTTGKLVPATLAEVEAQCELCDMPLDGMAPERSRLCYGCIRTMGQKAG